MVGSLGFAGRIVGLAVIVAITGAAVTAEPVRARSTPDQQQVTVITPDGDDSYRIDRPEPGGFDLSAPTSNTGGNLRMAIVDENAPISIDQESCVTWNGPVKDDVQAGLTLRVRTDGDRTRMIMISNNVWGLWRAAMNVHLVDSTQWPGRFEGLGTGHFTTLGDPDDGQPLPWRFCARVVGDRLSVKAWGTASAEPDWEGTEDVFRLTLPPEFVYDGRPGIYAGHLRPGDPSWYRHHVTVAIPQDTAEIGPDEPPPIVSTPG